MYLTQYLIILIYIFGSQFKFGDRIIFRSAMYITMNIKYELNIILRYAILGSSISFHNLLSIFGLIWSKA